MEIEKLRCLLIEKGIKVDRIVENNKASEVYVETTFIQDDGFEWHTYVPFIDRRAALNIETEEALAKYLEYLKPFFTLNSMIRWKNNEQKRGLVSGDVTSKFFKVLLSFKEEFTRFPNNPNSARRIQDIKDAGYTVASIPRPDGLKGYNRILLPIPIHAKIGYETYSPQFKARVIRLLKERNAYEAKVTPKRALIPDHKFSEVRWDEDTKTENTMSMSDSEIIAKFQLLDNQRNQQKREICRKCFQEGERGTIYGISYFYRGGKDWDENIPKKGKKAEKGCVGCPWYDIDRWRKELNEKINGKD